MSENQDYICRQDIICRLKEMAELPCNQQYTPPNYAKAFEEAIAEIEEMNAANVKLLTYGVWRKTHHPDIYKCSQCKKETKMDELCESRILRAYCPNCGVKMKEE